MLSDCSKSKAWVTRPPDVAALSCEPESAIDEDGKMRMRMLRMTTDPPKETCVWFVAVRGYFDRDRYS